MFLTKMKCIMAVSRVSRKLDRTFLSKSDIIISLICITFCCLYFRSFGSEYIWKNNISDNDAEDTMAFNNMKKYIFRPDLSNNLTGDEIVTTLHPGNLSKIVKSIALKYSHSLHNNYNNFNQLGVCLELKGLHFQ